MKTWLGFAVLLTLAACANGRIVHLARNGQTVQCGPYKGLAISQDSDVSLTNMNAFAERKLQACIEKYQDQGYQLVDPRDTAAPPR